MPKDLSNTPTSARGPARAGATPVVVAVGVLVSLAMATFAVPAQAADEAQPAKVLPIAAAIPDVSRESGSSLPNRGTASVRSRSGKSHPERRCGTMELGKTPKQ